MSTPVCLYLLDEPHVRASNERLELTPSRPTLLLIYLACRGEWVSREALAALFWPDSSEEEARHNLRVVLHRARSLPWAMALEVAREQVRFSIPTDVAAFRRALGQAQWEQAVRLHQRPFLQGFPLQDVPTLEDWATLERESLLEAWQQAAQRHAEALQQAQQHAEASRLLAEVLRQNLLAEDVLQNYLRAAYLAGQREAALRLYERFAQELKQELGLEPMRATLELAQALRRSEPLRAAPPKALPRIPLEVLHPPRLVGREAEQTRLRASSALLVQGEPGVGKSRLLQEVFPQAPLLRSREGLENVPFYAVLEHLKANLDSLPELGPYREDLARLLPEVYPGFTPPPAEPGSAKARLLEALARALAPAGRLLFDDLQWADEGTLELLLYLHSRGQPWVGAYRTHEVGPALARVREALRGSGVEELALKPLKADSVQALLADLIGVEEGPPVFAGWLHGQTGGNPFFALETLKALFENGVLRAEGGRWHTDLDEVTRDYSELQIPPKVAEVIRRRVGRLSEPALRVVQAASVLGEGFSPRLLAGVTGLSEWAVLEGVEEAEQAGIVSGERFVHDVLKQGIYQGLAPTRCRALHIRVAERLEGHAKPQVVAEHWFKAGDIEQAIRLWRMAAQQLSELGLDEEALLLNQRALEHATDPHTAQELQIDIGINLFSVSQTEGAVRLWQKVLEESQDVQVQVRALIQLAAHNTLIGQMSQARQMLEKLRQICVFEDLTHQNQQEVLREEQRLAAREGHFKEALGLAQQRLRYYDPEVPSVHVASLLSEIGTFLVNLGQNQEALQFLERSLAMHRKIGSRDGLMQATGNLLYYWITVGEPERGLSLAEEALKLDADSRLSNTEALRNNVANAYARLGESARAIFHYEINGLQARNPIWKAAAWATLARLYHEAGRSQEVEDAVDRAIESIAHVEFDPPRALVLIAALRYGSAAQVQAAQNAIGSPKTQALPPHLQAQLERAQADYLARVRSSKT
ncbi:AAA family ATPase [Meiothermus sp.]|uniref:ATP-binding protein n=1 Tax=Meiothermus sp. TaxID=1955249 RepID=UPI0021DC114E|nr:AAA family ATPase [Meiothermus sp.]GIW26133.1 MAG: transcriptional activator [Meiothermus sp.]